MVVLMMVVTPCGLVSVLYCKLAERLGISRKWICIACAVLAIVAAFPGYYVRFIDQSGHTSWWLSLVMAHLQQLGQITVPLAICWCYIRNKRDHDQSFLPLETSCKAA